MHNVYYVAWYSIIHRKSQKTYLVNPDVTPFVSVMTVLQVLHFADHFFVPLFSLNSIKPNFITAGTVIPTRASFEAILVDVFAK